MPKAIEFKAGIVGAGCMDEFQVGRVIRPSRAIVLRAAKLSEFPDRLPRRQSTISLDRPRPAMARRRLECAVLEGRTQ
jgi:hypothetical protein